MARRPNFLVGMVPIWGRPELLSRMADAAKHGRDSLLKQRDETLGALDGDEAAYSEALGKFNNQIAWADLAIERGERAAGRSWREAYYTTGWLIGIAIVLRWAVGAGWLAAVGLAALGAIAMREVYAISCGIEECRRLATNTRAAQLCGPVAPREEWARAVSRVEASLDSPVAP